MSLASNHLDAFLSIAREGSFSLAAKKLHLTQSALSQRILNLEQEVGSSLFIRESAGVRLTELGQKLLRYCQSKEMLENEFLANIQTGKFSSRTSQLSGIVRVAGFSTITQSILVPTLSTLISEHPDIQLEVKSRELRDLPLLLATGGTDFILSTRPAEKHGIETHSVGFEENVLIQSTSREARKDIYLDHDEEDDTTYDFFKIQGGKVPVLKRNYLGDINSIIEAVRLGIGQAVVPLHLVKMAKGVKIVDDYKPLKSPIYLHYYSQAFYTRLQTLVIERLQQQVPKYLKA